MYVVKLDVPVGHHEELYRSENPLIAYLVACIEMIKNPGFSVYPGRGEFIKIDDMNANNCFCGPRNILKFAHEHNILFKPLEKLLMDAYPLHFQAEKK